MYWYILYVRTGQEQIVERLIKEILDTDMFMPFIPIEERIYKIRGKIKKELKPLFPSYVFIESDLSGEEFVILTRQIISSSSNIVGVLKYSDTEIALRESEKLMLQSLCNDNYCVESSSGIIEGDKIIITGGPLRGRESIIKKVNRHKRQAIIEMEFLGNIQQVSVPLEIVEKF